MCIYKNIMKFKNDVIKYNINNKRINILSYKYIGTLFI